MGCCQATKSETEVLITQNYTYPQAECEEKFNDIPLSSQQSPLHFVLAQEDQQNSTYRLSYETTNHSNVPYTKLSLELAFICAKL